MSAWNRKKSVSKVKKVEVPKRPPNRDEYGDLICPFCKTEPSGSQFDPKKGRDVPYCHRCQETVDDD